MQRALRRVVAGRGGLRSAVVLSRPQGLVADGRRDLARRPARHRASPMSSSIPLAIGAFFAGLELCAADRLSEGEQPHQGGHGDGHRVLRDVRFRPCAVHQDRDRAAPQSHPVRQRAGRDGAGPDRDRGCRRRHARDRPPSSGAISCSIASIRTMPARSACRSACSITDCWCCSR